MDAFTKDVLEDVSLALGQISEIAKLVAAEMEYRPGLQEALVVAAAHAERQAERLDKLPDMVATTD